MCQKFGLNMYCRAKNHGHSRPMITTEQKINMAICENVIVPSECKIYGESSLEMGGWEGFCYEWLYTCIHHLKFKYHLYYTFGGDENNHTSLQEKKQSVSDNVYQFSDKSNDLLPPFIILPLLLLQYLWLWRWGFHFFFTIFPLLFFPLQKSRSNF